MPKVKKAEKERLFLFKCKQCGTEEVLNKESVPEGDLEANGPKHCEAPMSYIGVVDNKYKPKVGKPGHRGQKKPEEAPAPKAGEESPAPPPEEKPKAVPPVVEKKLVYDKLTISEYSTASDLGPVTPDDIVTMFGWEVEQDYQARMVKENPGTKPEHWVYGEYFHCLNTDKKKVRCWNNSNNRPFDMGWCEDLIHTVLNGQWAGPLTIPGETINGETIRIGKYGSVLSGQHQGTALKLANEYLQKERAEKGYEPGTSRYPFWNGRDECVIETIVITGLSEDERVLRTIDYVKPRTTADMLYTMELFRDQTPPARKELTRMLSAAIDLLWNRTDTKGYKTHPEVVGFLERHKRLLKCVEHLFVLNAASGDENGGRRISKLHLSPGQCSAVLYLMGCSSPKTDGDVYRNEEPPSEKYVNWTYWDRALEFWTNLAKDKSFVPVRMAFGRLLECDAGSDENQGMGGRLLEKLAILAKAWEVWRDFPAEAGEPFTADDLGPEGALCLSYTNLDDKGNVLPDGKIKLLDVADFYGIDCPDNLGKATPQGAPMPPPPTPDEIRRATEEARKRSSGKK